MNQRKYFGTDGIRGLVGQWPISADFMLRLGRAVGSVLVHEAGGDGHPKVLIGKDTRISGYMFESALEAGLVAAGADVGLSRKSMIGTLTGRAGPTDRAAGSAAAALIAVQRGARMVRVHDVAPTVDALAVWRAVHALDVIPKREAPKAAPRWPDDD